MTLDAFALTIPGRRPSNEDAICVRPDLGLFVVADGMGGYEGGEIASALTVEAIHELVRRTAGGGDVFWPYPIDPRLTVGENELVVATRLAADRIARRRTGDLAQMGSTVVVLRVVGDVVVVAHVGDSRVYRLRDGVLDQLTVDHSLLQSLIATGRAPEDLAAFPFRNVITRALGTDSHEPEVQRIAARPGDAYLLCSDGLTEGLDGDDIAALLAYPAERACRALVDAAFAAGSRDNISAIVVRLGPR
jgi:serine/threonine protein phosphatase PrpC